MTPQLSKWQLLTGPDALCLFCPWHLSAGGPSNTTGRMVMSAARFHAKDTGHKVQIHRSQVGYLQR